MGGPMALNLVKAGFELVVHDINPARVAPLVAAGATVEASAEAVAAKCHRTICMVETTDQAESVILGENGIIQSAKQGDIVLCMRVVSAFAPLIDYVSAILPRAQAVSRMPSAIEALRMCCQRRVAAGTCWRMRDRQRRKFRSSSWPRQYRLADPVLFNPSIGRHRPLMPR
jgi:hypothetical protein